MRCYKLLFFIPLFIVFTSKAQNHSELSGLIIDGYSKDPLISVSVKLSDTNDSTFIKTTSSDYNGKFLFNGLKPGSYKISFQYLGYKPTSTTITIEDVGLSISETFEIIENVRELDEVILKNTITRVEQLGDTTQFNAAAYKTNPDASAEDLVRKMPGISIENGQVKAQGEQVKRVTVDGKEFFGDDATLALRNLPAEVISKVQVFDRMSDQAQFSGVDDGEYEKTINIVTKPGMNNGLFGKVYAGYGTDQRYNAGGNINSFNGSRRISLIGMSNNINQQNFATEDILGVVGSEGNQRRGGGRRGGGRGNNSPMDNFMSSQQGGINSVNSFGINYSDEWGKKIKLSSSYFYNQVGNENVSLLNRAFFLNENQGQNYQEDNNQESRNSNHRFNMRMTYEIDSTNSIIFTPRLRVQSNSSSNNVAGLNTLSDQSILNRAENSRESDRLGLEFGQDILYMHRFAKKGRTITVNLATDYNDNTQDNRLYSLNEYYNAGIIDSTQQIDQLTDVRAGGYTGSLNIRYTEPIGEFSALRFTYLPSYTKNNSYRENNMFNPVTSDYSIVDSLLSNRFENTYISHRSGVSYRLRAKKNSFTLGANHQHATLRSDQFFPIEARVNRIFVNILPFARYKYEFSKTENIFFMYRTITREPSVNQLQPVIDNTNPLSLRSGNANLGQQYTHFFMSRYTRTNVEKGSTLFLMLFGEYADNYIGNSTLIAQNDLLLANDIVLFRGSQYSRPVNVSGYWNTRSMFTYGFPIKKIKSNLNLNAEVGYASIPGLINDVVNKANTTNMGSGFVLGSNISEKIDFTLAYTGNYVLVNNTLQPERNNDYYYHMTTTKFNWLFAKNFVLSTDFNNAVYAGLGEGFNQNIFLWNAALGYKFLKNNRGELRVTAFDLLNQNDSVSRDITESYVEDTQVRVLQRYYMLTFTYNFRHFKQASGS